jgi:excisionase family DNA binding protein
VNDREPHVEAEFGRRFLHPVPFHDGLRLEAVLPAEALEAVAQRVTALVLAELAPLRSPYMTVPEAAAYMRCSRQRVDDLLSQGRLTRRKDGARTLVERAEVDAYLGRSGAANGDAPAMPPAPETA